MQHDNMRGFCALVVNWDNIEFSLSLPLSLTCRLSRTGLRKLTKPQVMQIWPSKKKKNYTNVRSKNTKTLKGIRSVTKQSMHVLFWTINLFHGVYIPVMYSFLNYPHHYMHQVAFGYWWKWLYLRFWSVFFFFNEKSIFTCTALFSGFRTLFTRPINLFFQQNFH